MACMMDIITTGLARRLGLCETHQSTLRNAGLTRVGRVADVLAYRLAGRTRPVCSLIKLVR
jgi:hypothetical protein